MKANEPSYFLFAKFITRDGDGNVDATKLLSRDCYEAWLKTRKVSPRLPEESFRKALTSHCKGVAGMKPFAPDAEKAILNLLKKRQIWSCFQGTSVKIGIRGCHLQGYWESKRNTNECEGSAPKHSKQIDVDSISPVATVYEATKKKRRSVASREFSQHKAPRIDNDLNTRTFQGHRRQSCEVPTTNVESNMVDIPYFFSKVYVHNEEVYGRKSFTDYQIPNTANCPLNKSASEPEKEDVATSLQETPRESQKVETFTNAMPQEEVCEKVGDFGSIEECLASMEPCDECKSVQGAESEVENNEAALETIFAEVERQRALFALAPTPQAQRNKVPSLSSEELSKILSEFRKAMKRGGFVKDTLQSVFTFLPKKHLIMFIVNLYRNTGFSDLFPSQETVQDTLTTSEEMKHLYSKEFIIPSKNDRHFDPQKLIGMCLGDNATYSIIDQDEASESIYRGNIIGIPSIKLRVHKCHAGLYLSDMLAELFATKEAWTRSIEYRCDGTVMVLLNKYFMADKGTNCVLVQHQDITQQYSELL